jgi:hypothetical protein
MMQVDVENVFNNMFWIVILKKLWDVGKPLVSIIIFTKLFHCVHFSLLPTWATWRRGHHYWIIFKHEVGWPLGGLLFILAHYWTFLKTITQALNYVLPSLVGDIHIMGHMNEIVSTFDHLLTQLALIGLKVKVSKCKLWRPIGILLGIKVP